MDEPELRRRFRLSQDRFKASCPVPVETSLFTDFVEYRKGWDPTCNRIHAGFLRGEYGHTGLSEGDLEAIAASRRGLYRRWYRNRNYSDFVNILIAQGAEYAAMVEIIADKLYNPMVLGADHSRMAPFFSCSELLPVLYFRPNYLGMR